MAPIENNCVTCVGENEASKKLLGIQEKPQFRQNFEFGATTVATVSTTSHGTAVGDNNMARVSISSVVLSFRSPVAHISIDCE